jgi:hypothetical protein
VDNVVCEGGQIKIFVDTLEVKNVLKYPDGKWGNILKLLSKKYKVRGYMLRYIFAGFQISRVKHRSSFTLCCD